ncbi:hypothetical protein GQ44DRAFT_504754 [Phaeosphaeriaceae sp. PMI808]|nr:hypothetical protein GQ44DRAFT_504754 [Phaeosphaeriaceae sp. PMI808]
MVTMSIAKEIKTDTIQIRDDTEAIKQDTSEILQEIARLRAQLPNDQLTLLPSTQVSDSALARYLDDLTSYAETVCWSGEDSDTDVESDDASLKSKTTSKSPSTIATTSHKVSSLPPVSTKPPRLLSPIEETESDVNHTLENISSRKIPVARPMFHSSRTDEVVESQREIALPSRPATAPQKPVS